MKIFNKRKMIIGMLISVCSYGVTKYVESTTLVPHEDRAVDAIYSLRLKTNSLIHRIQGELPCQKSNQ